MYVRMYVYVYVYVYNSAALSFPLFPGDDPKLQSAVRRPSLVDGDRSRPCRVPPSEVRASCFFPCGRPRRLPGALLWFTADLVPFPRGTRAWRRASDAGLAVLAALSRGETRDPVHGDFINLMKSPNEKTLIFNKVPPNNLMF